MIKFFNTLTNKKEDFVPIEENKVSIYVCGPTVYNHAHIGNTRPMIVFDVLRRMFLHLGYHVTFVSNFTDVDDKIIQAAQVEGITEKELADKYIQAYEKVRKDLNLLSPTYTPRVTETMTEIIDFIQDLVTQEYAYEIEGDVYFRVSKSEEYGMLSGIKIEDLVAGASERVDDNHKKESPIDFALWKKTNDGLAFDSPWSRGRPGWHTECVVMINDIFEKGHIDIHGGGQDLKFPHHENEIAQSMACHHHPIANVWLHNQMVTIDNQKMSKSLGNVLWAKDLIETLGVNVYKWLMLSTHYRNPLHFTQDVLETVQKEVDRVWNALKQASLYLQVSDVAEGDYDKLSLDDFMYSLSNDLNTSQSLTQIIWEAKKLNSSMRVNPKNNIEIAKHYQTLKKMLDVLGFVYDVKVLSSEDIALYKNWLLEKEQRHFEVADQIRLQLQERGII